MILALCADFFIVLLVKKVFEFNRNGKVAANTVLDIQTQIAVNNSVGEWTFDGESGFLFRTHMEPRWKLFCKGSYEST